MAENRDLKKQLEELKTLSAYEYLTETEIPEIRATGVTMAHRKTGARVFLLLCGAAPDGKLAARLQAAGVALIAPDEKEAGQP